MKDRPLLMIPGPVEVVPAVLKALGAPTDSHVSPEFIDVFARVLEGIRKIWKSPSGQPFVVAGSGTMGMDMAAANLIEPGDKVLILSTGYFGERFSVLVFLCSANATVQM
jgi:alanine-glyoxylate transaminase/serine-glyoxylate transaminase/serine-pyruvate transaminase